MDTDAAEKTAFFFVLKGGKRKLATFLHHRILRIVKCFPAMVLLRFVLCRVERSTVFRFGPEAPYNIQKTVLGSFEVTVRYKQVLCMLW